MDEEAARLVDEASGERPSGHAGPGGHHRNLPPEAGIYGAGKGFFSEAGFAGHLYGDQGGASRFFYVSKAAPSERAQSDHPTQKPLELMRWLVRLVTPPGGTVLDPFAGSGTTGLATLAGDFRAVLIEREPEYVAIIRRRLAEADGPLFQRDLLEVRKET